ncbi:MAG: replication-associated recombination protein A [Fuerstiella sp.]|nr:replication-associated recombination protein A [Fuerstiella sp.]
MNLFAAQEQANREHARPLAARMRPESLDELIGQSHLLGEGQLLRRMLDADRKHGRFYRLGSMIFYGPPGTGKTSLAELIANNTNRHFCRLNATMAGVKDVRSVLEKARDDLASEGRQTICFIDEIHRFSRSQQDILLPDVEDGSICLIGATTTNPVISLVAPLISRSRIFEFQELTHGEMRGILDRALGDADRGLAGHDTDVDEEAMNLLVELSDGDARRALSALEIAVLSVTATTRKVDLQVAKESVQQRILRFDPTGDDHYDVASAYIKSIRGSDPDASLYWLARMLESGEDPRFIARRLVIAASEDIGNADPQALLIACAAFQSTETIGMPECRINLAQATTYLACSLKSNASCTGIDAALRDVRSRTVLPVPTHLRDRHYDGGKQFERGDVYQSPHLTQDGWCNQDYLGVTRTYYEPTDRGHEVIFRDRLQELRQRREQSRQNE